MVTAQFVRVHNGRLAQFVVPGVGKIYVVVKAFQDGKIPESLDVTSFGLREPTGEPVVASDKAAERAAKAQAKAEAAKAKAEARIAKAQAVADAAKAKADAMLARAAKAAEAASKAAASKAEAGSVPEGSEQPEAAAAQPEF